MTFLAKYADFGLLLLRVSVGVLFILYTAPAIMGGPSAWAHFGAGARNLGIHSHLQLFGFLAALLALSAVLLIGFAPVAWIFSASTESLTAMGALHLGFWIIATSFGLRFLYAAFATLNPKSVVGIRVWALIFVLVQLQMMTAIRPILGRSESFLPTQKKFFVAHWLDCLGNSVRGDARSTARD